MEKVQKLIKEQAEKENITEELKSSNQMLWISKMNNIKNIADEISSDGKYKFRYEKLLSFSLRYLTPVMILIILISSF